MLNILSLIHKKHEECNAKETNEAFLKRISSILAKFSNTLNPYY
jgi:hypothetical protein